MNNMSLANYLLVSEGSLIAKLTGEESFRSRAPLRRGRGELSRLILRRSLLKSSSAMPGVARVLTEGEGTSPVGSGPSKSIIPFEYKEALYIWKRLH